MSLSTNLRYLRKKEHLSQDELAQKLGYKSFTTIQKWETELSEPPIDTLKTISDIFHVSLDDLLSGSLPVYSNHSDIVRDPMVKEISAAINSCPELEKLFMLCKDLNPSDVLLISTIAERFLNSKHNEKELD